MEFYWLHDKFHPHRKTFQQHPDILLNIGGLFFVFIILYKPPIT